MSKIAAKEGEIRALPGSYSEMYPNRFIKADMLKGKKITLTIKEIKGEGLVGDDTNAKLEWIVSFQERSLQFVMNKTNAYCLYRMFGGDPNTWAGHKVTFFPTTTMAFGSRQDCIRVYGSPDLKEDMPITVPQGRKKAWETVMHRGVVSLASANGAMSPSAALDPRMVAAYELLDWNVSEQAKDRAGFDGTDAEYIKRLNGLVDDKVAREG